MSAGSDTRRPRGRRRPPPPPAERARAPGHDARRTSDRASKHNFERVDPEELLRRLARIPIKRWSYKAQDPSIRHIGPIAQDVWSAFGLGESDKRIDTIDANGIALAAIQGLYRRNQALERRNRGLRAQLEAQNARLTSLERAVSAPSR